MVKEFHPDHGGDPQLFELITHAFNVLYNDESRTAYDHAFKISKEAESDFNDMRTAAQEYLQAQDAKVDAQRKFFCHSLKQQYPNLTKEELEKMTKQAKSFDEKELSRCLNLTFFKLSDDIKLSPSISFLL